MTNRKFAGLVVLVMSEGLSNNKSNVPSIIRYSLPANAVLPPYCMVDEETQTRSVGRALSTKIFWRCRRNELHHISYCRESQIWCFLKKSATSKTEVNSAEYHQRTHLFMYAYDDHVSSNAMKTRLPMTWSRQTWSVKVRNRHQITDENFKDFEEKPADGRMRNRRPAVGTGERVLTMSRDCYVKDGICHRFMQMPMPVAHRSLGKVLVT